MITIDFNLLDIKPGSRILDIGCGEGRHTIKAGRQTDSVCVGADFGFENLVKTREKINFHRAFDDIRCRSLDLSCMDITSLPFKDNSFDIVLCSEVLEHIKEDWKAVSEIVRIVRPGKILAVSVPRFWPEKICWLLSDRYFNANMGHVRIYRKKDLVKKLEAAGVKLYASHHAHSLHAPYWWLKCLVGPDRTDSKIVNLYHRLLVWDLMKQPAVTKYMDKILNPLAGKSVVLYFKKSP